MRATYSPLGPFQRSFLRSMICSEPGRFTMMRPRPQALCQRPMRNRSACTCDGVQRTGQLNVSPLAVGSDLADVAGAEVADPILEHDPVLLVLLDLRARGQLPYQDFVSCQLFKRRAAAEVHTQRYALTTAGVQEHCAKLQYTTTSNNRGRLQTMCAPCRYTSAAHTTKCRFLLPR